MCRERERNVLYINICRRYERLWFGLNLVVKLPGPVTWADNNSHTNNSNIIDNDNSTILMLHNTYY